jgi:hypothetical protein
VRVFATALLINALRAAGQDPGSLLETFRGWKCDGRPVRRFGKDARYVVPQVDGGDHLCHVHLRPRQFVRWDAAHDAKEWSRKTSDSVLVYTANDDGDYLLIAHMDEGDAHRVARMLTPEDRQLMEAFAEIATQWRRTGAIIA